VSTYLQYKLIKLLTIAEKISKFYFIITRILPVSIFCSYLDALGIHRQIFKLQGVTEIWKTNYR